MAAISFDGHLGRDPESRDTKTGQTVCAFSVAVNNPRDREAAPVWYRVSVWGKSGEACQQYLGKGSHVLVHGDFWPRTYTKKDGTEAVNYDVSAWDVRFLGKPEERQETDSTAHIDDSDLPF